MTTANPSKVGAAPALKHLFTSGPFVAARDGLTWLGMEVLWSADILARLMVSVLVLRAVSRLTAEWFFPKEIWNQSDQILKGFAGDDEALPSGNVHGSSTSRPAGASTSIARSTRGSSSGPVPYSSPSPVRMRVVRPRRRRAANWCAAVAKVRTLHNDYFRDKDLYDLRDELVRTYGDRRRRNPGPDSTRPHNARRRRGSSIPRGDSHCGRRRPARRPRVNSSCATTAVRRPRRAVRSTTSSCGRRSSSSPGRTRAASPGPPPR